MRLAFLFPLVLVACASTSESDRANARLQYDMGVAQLNQGDPRGALKALTLAIEKDPEMAQAHNALGLVYHALGRGEEALGHYRRAVELKPAFSEAQNNMGTLLIDLGRYEEAKAAFGAALTDILYATPWLAEGNLGWAIYKAGDAPTAIKRLRNATAANPKFCRGYEWLARIGVETGDPEATVQSCRKFERYCAADPEIAEQITPEYLREMRYYLALGHLKSGDRDAARDAFNQCAGEPEEEGFGKRCRESLAALH